MLVNDPIEAIMRSLDPGVRTQAMADMEEAGCRVQTSASRGAGASHNQQYVPIYAILRRYEWRNPEMAALCYSLYALSEEESNQWIDALHDVVLAGIHAAFDGMTKKQMERARWISFAAIVARRSDLESVLPEWGPEKVAYYLAEQHGYAVKTTNWNRDYKQFWDCANSVIQKQEIAALKPISDKIREINGFDRKKVA